MIIFLNNADFAARVFWVNNVSKVKVEFMG